MSLLPPRARAVALRARAVAVLAAVAAAPVPAAGQDTTVVGSRSDSSVTVNMNVLDRTGSSGAQRRGRDGGQRLQLRQPDNQGRQSQGQTSPRRSGPEPGELVEGPGGSVLRAPPLDAPRSRLTVDPNALMAQGERQRAQTRTDGARQRAEPQTGARTQTAGRRDERESGMTAEGQAMASDGGPATASPSADGAASGAPEEPDLPEASAGAGDPDAPDAVTPERKPEPAERDTGGTRMAETGDSDGSTGRAEKGMSADEEMSADDAMSADAGATSSGEAAVDSSDGAGEQEMASTETAETGTGTDDAMAAAEAADGSGTASTSGTGAETAATDETGPDAGAEGGTSQGMSDDTGETQTAKRTPASEDAAGAIQLDFQAGSAKLSDSARAALDDLVARLKAQSDQRIQLKAYAQGGDDGGSRARRLSLSRALAVRSYLIDQGIRSTRMDVRALGDTAKAGPPDRVDIIPAEP